MSCIKVKVEKFLVVGLYALKKKGVGISAEKIFYPCISAVKEKLLSVTAISKNKAVIKASHICSYGSNSLLVVSPENVWLDDSNDYSADFSVLSNVEWKVEY